uniref:Cytoplasmic intermediate filament protein n=1 Tax=Phascolion strombus TaxID=74861 RepID=O97339_9ANNE|nr:cytoplasmic intermediate filament protein [Phascolion strombus]
MSTSVKISKSSEGPTTKTTSITREYSSTYRPVIKGRGSSSTNYGRSSYGGGGGYSMRQVSSYGMGSAMAPAGAYKNMSSTGVASIKTSRDREKKDMQDLNERFANYIEKVRFLEAQNRKLAQELDQLKQKWGKETAAVKAMYQAELDEARKLLDDAEKEKARLEIRTASLEEQIDEIRASLDDANAQNDEMRDRLERQNQQISEYVSEISVLTKRMQQLESDRDRDKKEIGRLQDSLNKARHDLDNETLGHIDAENRRQTLEEELEFLKNVHEQELKELAALAYRDTTVENREFWKSEMSSALREIQETYDEEMDAMRGELESYYNMKIQEFRTGASRQNMETVHAKETTKKMRDQLSALQSRLSELEARNASLEAENASLRQQLEEREREWEEERMELTNNLNKLQAELEAVLKELQDLIDTKLGLELEIAAYRKLLEGEENRVGLKQIVLNLVSGGHVSTTEYVSHDERSGGQSQVVKGEMSAKTTYQRSAKGPITICEMQCCGKYICVENTGRRNEQLDGWKIARTVDGRTDKRFCHTSWFHLCTRPQGKIWAKGSAQNPGPNDIESNQNSWGIGANITTKLVNLSGEDRATHVQKTMYSS